MSYTEMMARFGLIPSDTANEFKHWGFPQPEAKPGEEVTPDVIVTALRERAESADATEIRETDLDIIKQYTATRQQGRLHLVIRTLDGDQVNEGNIKIVFGRTGRGEYIIPWTSDSIVEYMVDADTYLQDGRKRVRFMSVREVWHGEMKSFMVATPEVTNDPEE